ncbi:calcium-binding protein, partial [Streptomyces sp. SID11233]|nr:calcium-binding protein [Streptomyces sp. SID11233]
GRIDAEEYRALFRTAFRRETAGADGSAGAGNAGGPDGTGGADTYDGAAFVRAFVSFMSGRLRSSPFGPLFR